MAKAKKFMLSEQVGQEANELEDRLLASIIALPDVESMQEAIDQLSEINADAPWFWRKRREDYLVLIDALMEDQKPTAPRDLDVEPEPSYKIKELARELVELRNLQKYIAQTETLMEEARQRKYSVKELINKTSEKLEEFQRTLDESHFGKLVSAKSLIPKLVSEVDKRHRAKAEQGILAVGLPTEFPTLDEYLGGLQEGIHLFAASPGSGKSTFALQIARNVSKQGFPVIFLSFEEKIEVLTLKCLCALADEPLKHFTQADGDGEELQALADEYGHMLDNLYFVQADHTTSIPVVKAKAKRLMKKTGKDKVLIVVDYLQYWAHAMKDKLKGSYNEFRHVVGDLATMIRRQLAQELNSPVLVISSQNRAGQGENKLTSLKEAGELEYGADSVWFLTEPKESEAQPVGLGGKHVVLHIEKNRYGEKGKIDLSFYPSKAYFEEM